jgi:periplasmic divalent cation tolerance protein
MERVIQITITSDRRDALETIARNLLEKRLASCVQILGPMKSLYRWKGKIEETEEWLGIIKTRKILYQKAEEELRRLHHYEVPEIMAFEADAILPDYSQWVTDETLTTPWEASHETEG